MKAVLGTLIPTLATWDQLFFFTATTFGLRAAPLASIRQMSRQVSRGSAGEYQADEQVGVARLRWRVSGR